MTIIERKGPVMTENWHTLKREEALRKLDARRKGLSPEEASERLGRYGPNELREKKKAPAVVLFLKQFMSPLVYILAAAAGVSVFVDHYMDAAVILFVLLLNAVIGFIQESQAQKAMEALMKLASPRATVRRGGKARDISATELVPGDIVVLETGDRVPADARLLEESNLKVNESALTGESVPVGKHTRPVDRDLPLAERRNMLYSGTSVSVGRATALVVGTGMSTELGKITAGMEEVEEEKTPVQKSIDRLSRYILVIVVCIVGILAGVGFIRGIESVEVFLLSVAAAVSAIPEGLPAVVTVVLSMGMKTLAGRNAVIRRLVAVETLGSATVICSDKTGTLTMNQMTVRDLFVGGERFEVTGEGYQPKGEFRKDGRALDPDEDELLRLHLTAGMLCNDALLSEEDGAWEVLGDPTEGALVVAGGKAGMDKEEMDHHFPRLDEIPFQSENKYMATLHHREGGKRVVYLKGSPEKILSLCSFVKDRDGTRALDDEAAGVIREANEDMAGRALRVIATGFCETEEEMEDLEEEHLKGRVAFLGLFGMADPPRDEAVEALKRCRHAGIQVKMITGDNQLTAESIARQMGFSEGRVVTGRELSEMEDEELAQQVEDIAVFARIDPLHKLRIVNALKDRGHVVAVTGDGVNDAPALKAGNIGIAMGITGTDVAKEASDMVLADDNFASVVAAVEEGRAIFNRLRNVVFFLLSTNIGELLALIAGVGLIGKAPLLAVQILWVNLVTDTSSAVPLGMEPKLGNELDHPPRHHEVGLLYPGLLLRVGYVALLKGGGLYLIFSWALGRMSIEEARTLAFTSMVAFEWFMAFNARSDEHTVFALGMLKNPWLILGVGAAIALQAAVLYVPPLQRAFGTVGLSLGGWGIAFAAGGTLFIIEEVRKIILSRLFMLGKWRPVKSD